MKESPQMKQMTMRAFLGVLSSLECRGYRMAKYLHERGEERDAVLGSHSRSRLEKRQQGWI